MPIIEGLKHMQLTLKKSLPFIFLIIFFYSNNVDKKYYLYFVCKNSYQF